jgi:predicted transposase YdaD
MDREDGRKEGISEIIRNMLEKGLSDEEIVSLTGCDLELICRIKEKR